MEYMHIELEKVMNRCLLLLCAVCGLVSGPIGGTFQGAYGAEKQANVLNDSDEYELKGEIKTIDFDSKHLGESREVKVYLPPGHDRKKRYPVVYSVDGLDGVDCELLEPLITSGKVPPFIVVSTVQSLGEMRQKEYCPGWRDGEEAFAAHEKFFIEEVIPWAEREWGASRKRKDRALRGSSNGGPFVLTMANRHSELFGHVFAMMVYGLDGLELDTFERELKEQPKDPTRYILVVGSQDAHGVKENQDIVELLKKKKFPVSSAVIDGAGHMSRFCQEELVGCIRAAYFTPMLCGVL